MTQRTTIFEEGASQVIEVTIPAGETESAAFDIGSASAVGFVMPADGQFSGQNLTILVGASADGPFYPTAGSDGNGAVVLAGPTADNKARALSAAQFSNIAPFRFLKLQSDAPTGGLTGDGDPISVVALVDDPLLVGAEILTGTLADLGGNVFAGDTFTIEGDSTVYTVLGTLAAGSDFISPQFTPPIVLEAPAGSEVTFNQVGVRGEAAARTFQVITKD